MAVLYLFVGFCFANDALESKIKAGYLYNFTKFIKWPDSQTTHFNLCLLGPNPFGDLLASLEEKLVASKPIRIHKLNALQDQTECQMLYVDNLALLSKSLSKDPKKDVSLGSQLTVSSQLGFVDHGGMIEFVIVEDKIKLKINLKMLQLSGLTVSAKLLEVATLVEGGSGD